VSGTITVTLRLARGAPAQQAALDAWLDARQRTADERSAAVIAEGAFCALQAPATVDLVRLAPGCVCCAGQVVLRVQLTRLLRQRRPREVLLLLATGAHREQVADMLRNGALGIELNVLTEE
jgi:G3E family GTPase